MKKWQPIAEGDLSAKLTKKLAEIAGVLREIKDKKENPGLMGGKAGIALFLSYYAKFSGDDTYADRAFDLFSEIFDMVNNGFNYHTFAGGLAGIGWAMEHVVNTGLFEADTDEILSDVDPYLYQMMIAEMKEGEFDYLHGALGIVLYFLRRQARPDFPGDRMVNLLNELDAHAEVKGKGLRWISVIDIKSETRGYDLSLSHGLSSIICILAKLRERNIAPEQVERLLAKAAAYMLEQELDTQKYPAHFPGWIGAGHQQPSYHTRLAWCNGDLGIGMTLWNASRVTNNREWERKAVEVLLHSTSRKDHEKEGVIDAGICHGAAGIAHIYNRIYQEIGIQSFKDTALYWLEKALDPATFPDGYAGYKAFRSQKHGWIPDASFLEGIAGIGLAFLSAISATPARWDEALLLS